MEVPGIGPVIAGRLIARAGHIDRFATAAAYANDTGTAPIEIASVDKGRHRLSRTGDRQLNATLHTIAIVQIRMAGSRAAPTTTGRSPRARARKRPGAA